MKIQSIYFAAILTTAIAAGNALAWLRREPFRRYIIVPLSAGFVLITR